MNNHRKIICFSILLLVSIFNSNAYAASLEIKDSKGNLILTTNPTKSDTLSIGSSAIPGLISLVLAGIFIYLCFIKQVPRLVGISDKILNFEISKRVAILAILSILSIFSIFIIPTLDKISPQDAEYSWNVDYYDKFKAGIEPTALSFRPVTFTLFYISDLFFHNLKVMPFIASIGIILLTYGITLQITKKRIAGILAVIVLTQSMAFLNYVTVTSYPIFWIFFYLLSLYLMFKNWVAAVAAFYLAVFAKVEALLLLPTFLFFVYKYLHIRKKMLIISVISLVIIRIIFPEQTHTVFTGINLSYIWNQLLELFLPMRNDLLILTLLCPLIVWIIALRQRGIKEADIILVSLINTVLHLLLISSVTNESVRGDRCVPLVIFFGMGIGIIFSKNILFQVKEKNILYSYCIGGTLLLSCLMPTIALVFPALLWYN